jgi:hypothetical protein
MEPNADEIVALVATEKIGLKSVADGAIFALAHEVNGTAKVDLRRRLTEKTSTLVTAGYKPATPIVAVLPPAGAAIVVAMRAFGSKIVPLRMILGSAYDPATHDGAAIINASSREIFAAGLKVTNTEEIVITLKSPLYLCDNFNVNLGDRTLLVRDFVGYYPGDSCVRNRSYTTALTNVRWLGGRIEPRTPAHFGPAFRINVDTGLFRDIVLVTVNDGGSGSGHGMNIFGNDITIINVRHTALPGSGVGSMSFRVNGGRNIEVRNCTGDTYDDFCGVVITTDLGVAFENAGATNIRFIDCVGKTLSKLCVVSLSRNGGGGQTFAGLIDGVVFQNVSGEGGYSILKIEADDVAPGAVRIDNVTLNCPNARTTDGVTAQPAYYIAGLPGAIGRVKLLAIQRQEHDRARGLHIDAPGSDVTAQGHITGVTNPIRVYRPQGRLRLLNASVEVLRPGDSKDGNVSFVRIDEHPAAASDFVIEVVGAIRFVNPPLAA